MDFVVLLQEEVFLLGVLVLQVPSVLLCFFEVQDLVSERLYLVVLRLVLSLQLVQVLALILVPLLEVQELLFLKLGLVIFALEFTLCCAGREEDILDAR